MLTVPTVLLHISNWTMYFDDLAQLVMNTVNWYNLESKLDFWNQTGVKSNWYQIKPVSNQTGVISNWCQINLVCVKSNWCQIQTEVKSVSNQTGVKSNCCQIKLVSTSYLCLHQIRSLVPYCCHGIQHSKSIIRLCLMVSVVKGYKCPCPTNTRTVKINDSI